MISSNSLTSVQMSRRSVDCLNHLLSFHIPAFNMSWCKNTTCVVPLSFEMFNLLKFILTSLVLGWAVGMLPESIERYRRAYYLRKKGKVQIAGPTNFLFRALGISTSPWTIRLTFACFIVLVIVEIIMEVSSKSAGY